MPKKKTLVKEYWQNDVAELKEKMIQLEIKIADSDFKFGLLLDEVRASNDLLKKLTKDFQANL